MELLAPRAQGKGLEIASFVSADVPARLVGDGNRLRQALLNLGGNAVKFTEAGWGRRRGRHATWTAPFCSAWRTRGPACPPAGGKAMFEEFEQADGSFTRRHGGVGARFGDHRAHRCAHGGRAWFSSRAAAADLRLPSACRSRPDRGPATDAARRGRPRFGGCWSFRRSCSSRLSRRHAGRSRNRCRSGQIVQRSCGPDPRARVRLRRPVRRLRPRRGRSARSCGHGPPCRHAQSVLLVLAFPAPRPTASS